MSKCSIVSREAFQTVNMITENMKWTQSHTHILIQTNVHTHTHTHTYAQTNAQLEQIFPWCVFQKMC
jgi:hypothetical protein